MTKLFSLVVGLAVGSAATWLVLHRGHDHVDTAEPITRGTDSKPSATRLPAAKREQMGITLVHPASRALIPEVQAFGRVLDPTPFATVIAEVETARATLTASEKELERATKLFAAGGNASAQTVETTQAAAGRDRAALGSAQARLTATWGRSVAQKAAEISTALEKGGSLVRLDLLAGESPAANLKEASLTVPGQANPVAADIIGPAPSADAQIQGVSFLALLKDAALPAGTALRATLPGIGHATEVLVLPRSAIVYHQGSAWVFVLGDQDTFQRKLVTVVRNTDADTVAIVTGLERQEQVAVTGTQQLLSAELQAGGAEGP